MSMFSSGREILMPKIFEAAAVDTRCRFTVATQQRWFIVFLAAALILRAVPAR